MRSLQRRLLPVLLRLVCGAGGNVLAGHPRPVGGGPDPRHYYRPAGHPCHECGRHLQRQFRFGLWRRARGWVGYQNCDGWGLRTRFWDFRDDQNVATIDSPTVFANGTYAPRAYTIDLEVFKEIDAGYWAFDGALGGRYARLEQDQTLIATSSTIAATGFASRYVSGTGLTGFLEARRALGDSNWNAFANIRGSVLWGSDYGAAGSTVGNSRLAENDANGNTLCIFETQIGVEWTQPLQCICGTLFLARLRVPTVDGRRRSECQRQRHRSLRSRRPGESNVLWRLGGRHWFPPLIFRLRPVASIAARTQRVRAALFLGTGLPGRCTSGSARKERIAGSSSRTESASQQPSKHTFGLTPPHEKTQPPLLPWARYSRGEQ